MLIITLLCAGYAWIKANEASKTNLLAKEKAKEAKMYMELSGLREKEANTVMAKVIELEQQIKQYQQ